MLLYLIAEAHKIVVKITVWCRTDIFKKYEKNVKGIFTFDCIIVISLNVSFLYVSMFFQLLSMTCVIVTNEYHSYARIRVEHE